MEYVDLQDIARAWTILRNGGGSIKCWVLFVKEKVPDKGVEVYLTNVLPKRMERSGGVPRGWINVSECS